MAYPRTLSPKTLKKRYSDAGIDEKKLSFLKDFFLAADNLYGVIMLNNLWSIYKQYDEYPAAIQRKDLIAYTDIARRDDLPYFPFEISEIYSAEKDGNMRRLIIDKRLIGGQGSLRYLRLDKLMDSQRDKPYYYIPDDLDEFLAFAHPEPSVQEKALRNYLDNLEVRDKSSKDYGRKLKDFHYITRVEQHIYETMRDGDAYTRANPEKAEEYLASLVTPTAEVLFEQLEWAATAGFFELSYIFKQLTDDLDEIGTMLSKKETKKVTSLYTAYHNTHHSWADRGWTPAELSMATGKYGVPEVIELGDGFREMLQNGMMNLKDIEDYFRKAGVKVLRIGDREIRL